MFEAISNSTKLPESHIYKNIINNAIVYTNKKGKRLLVPESKKSEIIKLFHSSNLSTHPGIQGTFTRFQIISTGQTFLKTYMILYLNAIDATQLSLAEGTQHTPTTYLN
ncbi:hypothetical protein A3Q56_08720 [Intoshia linei]|uniref:Integrase zinc-binding domain-containing protein n=1 Tax=Intoshia linei TaxID=1819745 RepID=A0A177APW7_9BILA|nr:hypothetical protein A3Q56_08720 [Intoshia linei]